MTLFDFSSEADLSNWRVVDDVVMGGRSDGGLTLSAEGHAVYSGEVSLENNGGFSSLRYQFAPLDVSEFTHLVLRVKGDGKRYQVRAKTDAREYASYVDYFTSSGEWETVRIPLREMTPTFRGRRLNLPDYPGEEMAEFAILIGNKKNESFRLVIDWVKLD
ncbi:CIA30 family protein [Lewinella sp. W8]|uniref:CIA30 family protein n=1 Tax=Lewinella sp. W8 TaxID=2528208 RepID=UPI0020A6D7E4|nr:CIA30 family protein [Lewinella sp. W8]